MTYKNIRAKYKTTLFGLLGSLIFAVLCILLYLMGKGELIFPLLYMPGAIFGLTMAVALKEHSGKSGWLFILSSLAYLAMIFFCTTDIEYFVIRRICMGGIGAVLFLAITRGFTSIKLHLSDFVMSFVIGIAATIFTWTENFGSFDPWLMIVSIVLWQTLVAAIVNRRQLIMAAKLKN